MMPVLGLLLMSPKDIQTKFGRHIASEPEPEQPQQQQVVQETVEPEAKPEVAQPQPEAKPEVAQPQPEAKPEVAQPQPEAKPEVAQPVPGPKPEPQIETAASTTPKLDSLLSSVEVPARSNPVNLNSDMLKEDISTLLSRVSKAEEFDKNTVEKPALDKLREEIKASAIELRQVENSLKDLMNPEDVGDLPSRISEARIRLEASLKDLEETEALVAARTTEVKPETEVATTTPEVKPETTPEVKPDVNAERAPSVVSEETKPEVKPEAKPETKTEEKDPILCALEEQNKLLQQQLQGFIQQQSLIMQQLLSMSQMMMMQNMYRMSDTFNYHQAYQYHQPQVAGNWVYYPQGLQPIQPGQTVPGQQSQADIFGLNNNQAPQTMPMPQMPMGGYGMGMGMGMYPQMQPPGMMSQMPGQWGLGSQFNHTPGTFSMDAQGFNLTPPAVTGVSTGAGVMI